MNKKIQTIIALFILNIALSGSADAKAGMFDWATGENTDWTFEHVYNGLVKQADQSEIKDGQEINSEENFDTQNEEADKTELTVLKEYVVVATAYSSTVDQTDDTPYTTAWGTTVRDGIVAANFLPFGTVIRIPDVYGDKEFVVEDRMNKRYWHRVDIWFPERQMAKEFGIKQIKIEIVSS